MRARHYIKALDEIHLVKRYGRVKSVASFAIEADGPDVPIGSLCEIDCANGQSLLAEVTALRESGVILSPLDAAKPIFTGAQVTALNNARIAPVGDAFAGRAVNAMGAPLDGGGSIRPQTHRPLEGVRIAPLDRAQPLQVIETGLKAIDGLFTIGAGQRIGVFAAAGVGKTTLQSQLAANVQVDRLVLCLVGERGREIDAAWSKLASAGTLHKATLVAAASDETPAMRARAVEFALCLAEFWRDQGLSVGFMLDSATRYAMALREIGLAAGEPATMRAYTPNVFSALPRVVERCGARKAGGSITAFMTVLAETDDVEDPLSEVMKSLLDGHIVLSRNMAELGVYPAIDATRSLSRFASTLWSEKDRQLAERALQLFGVYEASKVMIEAGVYASGSNPDTDQAIARRTALLNFVKQRPDERIPIESIRRQLEKALTGGPQ